MLVESLYIYPIKGLRAVPLTTAELTPQGIKRDRRFMLWSVADDGSLKTKMQVMSHPECALFQQSVVGDRSSLNVYTDSPPGGPPRNGGRGGAEGGAEEPSDATIVVRYVMPDVPLVPHHPAHDTALEIPLEPGISDLEPVDMEMYGSEATAYRMGDRYDEWFSSCLGYRAALLYIGDGRRPQLGFRPGKRPASEKTSFPLLLPVLLPVLLRLVLSYLSNLVLQLLSLVGLGPGVGDWIVFTDLAPYLVASSASLSDVSARIKDGPIGMHRFRPNIVVGPGQQSEEEAPSPAPPSLTPWAEDFWSRLTIVSPSPPPGGRRAPTLQLTGNCCRCVSVNVDYATGRPSTGTRGTVLKSMMADRRVDGGRRWDAVFGRYASLLGSGGAVVGLGDRVVVETRRGRDVWDWPPWEGRKPKVE